MAQRRGFGVRYDGGGQRRGSGKAADRETWLTEFLRDVVDDLREKVALLFYFVRCALLLHSILNHC